MNTVAHGNIQWLSQTYNPLVNMLPLLTLHSVVIARPAHSNLLVYLHHLHLNCVLEVSNVSGLLKCPQIVLPSFSCYLRTIQSPFVLRMLSCCGTCTAIINEPHLHVQRQAKHYPLHRIQYYTILYIGLIRSTLGWVGDGTTARRQSGGWPYPYMAGGSKQETWG